MGRIIGIDLGTTNSCVAVLDGSEVKVIPNELGMRTSPSVVGYRTDGSILVGEAAKRQAVLHPSTTLLGVKRLIGRNFDSPEVQELKKLMAYPIICAPNGDAWVRAGMFDASPPEISANVLRYMKQIAEDYLGDEVTRAIITVPAYFDDPQRQATKDAGAIAGLDVLSILNEPTAAAVAYGIHKSKTGNTIAVFDLGGGTFDVSILRIEEGVFEVLATNGDTFLGGDDFDRAMSEALLAELKRDSNLTITKDPAVMQRLKAAVETAKHELSSTTKTEINLPFIAQGANGPSHLQRVLERSWLEKLTKPLIDRLQAPCEAALHDAGVLPEHIDHLILVGGMTRMPAVIEKATAIFKRPASKGVNPDEIVAVGAATQAGIMAGTVKQVVLLDVSPHSLGIRTQGDRVSTIIKRNSTVPLRETRVYQTTEDEQEFVTIEIVQGENASASLNRQLGKFVLGDLPKKPAGMVQVQVSFALDADGILNVNATEASTGKATSKKILASSGLSREDVKRLAAESGIKLVTGDIGLTPS